MNHPKIKFPLNCIDCNAEIAEDESFAWKELPGGKYTPQCDLCVMKEK